VRKVTTLGIGLFKPFALARARARARWVCGSVLVRLDTVIDADLLVDRQVRAEALAVIARLSAMLG
jgi:hypothetical protein